MKYLAKITGRRASHFGKWWPRNATLVNLKNGGQLNRKVKLYNISFYVVISVVLLISNDLDGYQRLDQYDSCNLIYKDYKGHYFDIDGNRRNLGNARAMQKFEPHVIEVIDYVIKRIIAKNCSLELDLKVSIIVEKDGCLSNFRIISGISECHKNIIRLNLSPLDCVGSWPKPDKELELVFDVHVSSY